MKMARFRTFVLRLARADIAFYLLPPIMMNLVAGTIAQRELGLFEAQRIFFSSFVIWAGPIPLPGGYVLTGALTFCLMLKFFLASDWRWKKVGINLSHLGVLILLTGGLFTALTAREGYMMIAEGDSTPYVYDYHNRRLYIFENDTLIKTKPFGVFEIKDLPFSIFVRETCTNCAFEKRENVTDAHHGMARGMELKEKPPETEPEKNISGVTIEISGTQNNQDGIYIAFEGMPKPVEIKSGEKTYKIMFGREQRLLPFAIKLNDFEKETHPGTDKASAYSSDVSILEQNGQWPARIEMNAPLRYKGYTFFQSSFDDTDAREITVLSVVENKGRLFPYIGTFVIGLGLLLHFILRMQEGVKK